MRQKLGIVLSYASALLIMLSILFLFRVIRFPFPYSTAAFGFLLYIVGMLLSREGKLTAYRVVMLAVSGVLILVALYREFFS
jgi:hypothetical protein